MGCFVPYFITILLSLIPGVPGVLPEKLDEGMKVQHCALSLVGEPIMYPEINRFVRMLHEKGYLFSQMVTYCKLNTKCSLIRPSVDFFRNIELPCNQCPVSGCNQGHGAMHTGRII